MRDIFVDCLQGSIQTTVYSIPATEMVQSMTREDEFSLVPPALHDICKGDNPGLRLRSNCGDFNVNTEVH
eukprot:8088042-Ditylum_brightwellii.AAC.1